MSGLINSTFYDTDISSNNTDIDYSKLTIEAKPLESVYADVQIFLDELEISKHVKTRRTHIQYLEPVDCNKLMFFLMDKYMDDACVTNVDLFGAVLDVVDIDGTEFYQSLTDKIKGELKNALQISLGFEMNFDEDRDQMDSLGLKQVQI